MLKNKPLMIVITVIFCLFIFAAAYFFRPQTKTVILPNQQEVKAEIADTTFKQTKGLMFRKTLPENAGMLFIYQTSAKRIFWMKNTLIPLDMIWIDENFKIADITKDVPPCETESCPRYMPSQAIRYILEVNAGYAEKQNLKVGDTVSLK